MDTLFPDTTLFRSCEGLRRPHLVLADCCRNDRVHRLGQREQALDRELRHDRIAVVREREALLLAPGVDSVLPRGPALRLAVTPDIEALRENLRPVAAARQRPEERRVGKECVGTSQSRWAP